MPPPHRELPSRRATLHLAQRLARLLAPSDLVVLGGPLGSGKTFFVRGLLRALGLERRERVTSPTFALVQDFATTPRVVHADLYRLTEPRQLLDLGLDEARRQGSVLLVEWGTPFIAELGGDALQLVFDRLATSDNGRTLRLEASGPRSSVLLAGLGSADP